MLSARLQRDEMMGANAGQTIRQPSTALLTIDSEDRYQSWAAKRNAIYGSYNYSPYDFTITKNESLMNGFFTRLAVTEIVFPWNIPNINTQTNKMLITYGAIPTTAMIFVPQSFYTPTQLATALQGIIVGLDPTLVGTTVTYGASNEPVFEFTFPVATKLSPMPYQPDNTLPFYYPYRNTKQLFDMLGLNTVVPAAPTLLPLIGDSTFCQATRYVDVVCSVLTYNQSLKDTTSQPVSRDSLCRVYLGTLNSNMSVPAGDADFAPPGTTPGIVYVNYSTPKQIQWIPNQPVPSGLRFQIFDDEGTALDDIVGPSIYTNPWIGDINWSMTLLISEN